MKLIARGEAEKDEFYDLSKDPKETVNSASSRSQEMLQVRKEYLDFQKTLGGHEISMDEATRVNSPELLEQLKALGYLN